MSVPEWHDLQRSGIFAYISPLGGGSVNLTGASHPMRLRLLTVAPNYFALLRVQPQLGRGWNPADRTPGFLQEAILSDGLWRRAFGADPRILERSLRFDNDLYRIIGVMPPGFHDPGQTTQQRNTEVWAAAGFAGPPAPPPQRHSRVLQEPEIVARLAPGLSVTAAQGRLDALVAALQRQFPGDYPARTGWTVRLVPLREAVLGGVRRSLVLLLGAVGLVLLIGCVNVANLLLARASGRRREMAVRQALGAGRRRLAAQLLSESLLLALAGGLTGLAILFGTRAFLLRLVPDSLPRLNEISISWSVLAFTLATSLAAGVVFGLAPALDAGSRLNLLHLLKLEGRGTAGSREHARTRRVLVATELALSLVLMSAAGLLLRSFGDLLAVRPGFRAESVMAARLWLPVPNDPQTDVYRTAAQEGAFLHEVLRRARTLPGVQEAAVGNLAAIPLGHDLAGQNRAPAVLEGQDARDSQTLLLHRTLVTPEYQHLLGLTLLRGRFFDEHDNDHAPPVAVINQTFARTYYPHADPLGRRLRLQAPDDPASLAWTATVIGVLADARTESLADAAEPQFYLSLYQRPTKDLAIFVRGRLDPGSLPRRLREQVQSIDPELPVFGAQTLDQVLTDSLAARRFSVELVGLFAFTALLLAGLGIFGVISYLVSERVHEIGIRLALGASRRQVLTMVLRDGLGLAATGAAIGLAGALAVSHAMRGLLYGVQPTDPLTFLAGAALLLAVALCACYLPARRATGIDPTVALKQE